MKLTYYHVYVITLNAREAIELDFSKDELVKRIVEPYKKGEPFMCDGKPIDPFAVEKIQINETDEPSSVLLPRIKAEREAKRAESNVVVIGISDEWYVTEKGRNVTREFVTAPPKRGLTSPKIPSRRRLTYPKAVRETVWGKCFRSEMTGKCYVCKKPIHFTDFEVGHNKPLAKGGTSNINNLRPICRTCNRSMGTMAIETFKKKYFG